ncbi:MAG: hypothetical protein JO213_21655 [Alphaproteobacteria bacterium]|nr:hypothetical protein [Alphaproteobacteria bacterium]
MSATDIRAKRRRGAVLDDAPVGDIRRAFGTIRQGDHNSRTGWRARLRMLPAILGPGLVVELAALSG